MSIITAGMRLPTDEEIIEAYQKSPTPETVKSLCTRCRSESRPIRVLCRAGLMEEYRAVRWYELPKINRPRNASKYHIRYPLEVKKTIYQMKSDGATTSEVMKATGLSQRQIEDQWYRMRLEGGVI